MEEKVNLGLTNTNSLSGVGNDISHQLIIAVFCFKVLSKTVRYEKYKDINVLPEISYRYKDGVKIDKTPDLIIDNGKKCVVFEVCDKKNEKKDAQKIETMMKNNKSIIAGYVINKENLNIVEISKDDNNKIVYNKNPKKIEIIDLQIYHVLNFINKKKTTKNNKR